MLAFVLVSAGIIIFSLAGDVYQPVKEGQEGLPPGSSDPAARGTEPQRGPQDVDVESQRLLASALATRGRTPVVLGKGDVDSLQQDGLDRRPRLADVELECRDSK